MRQWFSCFLALLLWTSCVPAFAQDTGVFVRSGTSSLTNPQANETWLLDTSDDNMKVYMGSSVWQIRTPPKFNMLGSGAPTANDDSGDGYSAGSVYYDTVGKQTYICTDATATAAVWSQFSNTVTPAANVVKLTAADWLSDYVVSGLLGTDPGASLAMTTPSGVAYVSGSRITSSGGANTYTASKDTYDFLQTAGTISHVAVNNGAGAPSGQPGLFIQKVVTNGTEITGVTQTEAVAPAENIRALSLRFVPSGTLPATGQYTYLVGVDTPAAARLINMVDPGISTFQYAWLYPAQAYTAGGVGYANGNVLRFTAAGTSGQPLISNGASAPGWGAITVAGGGTGLTALGAANQIFGINAAGNAAEYKSFIAGTNISITYPSAGQIQFDLTSPGTVTTFSATPASVFDVATATTTPALSMDNQSARTALMGPVVGASATTPAFRVPNHLDIFGDTSNIRAFPTSGTVSGVYYNSGNWTSTSTITIDGWCVVLNGGTMNFDHAVTGTATVGGGLAGYAAASPAGNGAGAAGGSAGIPNTTNGGGGGGGGHGGAGGHGGGSVSAKPGVGGATYPVSMSLAGSGGGGGLYAVTGGAAGGAGGASFVIESVGTVTINANITLNGAAGAASANGAGDGGGGGGSGGGFWCTSFGNVTVNAAKTVACDGGAGGAGGATGLSPGGGGGGGIVFIRCTGTYTNSGTVQAAGGAAGANNTNTIVATAGAAGIVDTASSTTIGPRPAN